FGSNFHQFRPICSALSTEQISSRMRIVSNSTLASDMRTSPATTSPLSRMRSRMSSRLVVPETVAIRSMCAFYDQKRKRRAQQGYAHILYPSLAELSAIHASNCLAFQQPAQKFDKPKNQLCQTLFH